jgi:hypothetical protein
MKKYCINNSYGRPRISTQKHRGVFSFDSGPRLGTENVSDIVECFEFFFYKEIIQQIVRKINIHEERFKNARDNLFPLCSFVRLRIPDAK